MIAFLHGKLVDALPTQVTVDVHGVGYEVLIPLSSFDKLPAPGGEVRLLTHLAVREDAHVLYGFMSAAERELFRLLINTVSGIGPKIALNILSGMNPVAFRGALKPDTRLAQLGRLIAEAAFIQRGQEILRHAETRLSNRRDKANGAGIVVFLRKLVSALHVFHRRGGKSRCGAKSQKNP